MLMMLKTHFSVLWAFFLSKSSLNGEEEEALSSNTEFLFLNRNYSSAQAAATINNKSFAIFITLRSHQGKKLPNRQQQQQQQQLTENIVHLQRLTPSSILEMQKHFPDGRQRFDVCQFSLLLRLTMGCRL